MYCITGWWWLEPWNFEWLSIQLGIVTPTDELIFFRGVGIPPTRLYCYIMTNIYQQQNYNLHPFAMWKASVFLASSRHFSTLDSGLSEPLDDWVTAKYVRRGRSIWTKKQCCLLVGASWVYFMVKQCKTWNKNLGYEWNIHREIIWYNWISIFNMYLP